MIQCIDVTFTIRTIANFTACLPQYMRFDRLKFDFFSEKSLFNISKWLNRVILIEILILSYLSWVYLVGLSNEYQTDGFAEMVIAWVLLMEMIDYSDVKCPIA